MVQLQPSFDCPQYVVDQVLRKRGRLRVFDEFKAASTALVVIDMQNYYVDQLPEGRAAIPKINKLASALRERGGVVVWVSMTTGEDGQSLWPLYHSMFHTEESAARHRDGLTRGERGHELASDLDTDAGDVYVEKTKFSPFSPGASNLLAILQDRQIENLIVAGVATNFCCETTVRDAMMLDYRAVIVSDGTAARFAEDHIAGLTSVFQSFGDVLTADEIIDELIQA